jgi:alpha-galactosidase
MRALLLLLLLASAMPAAAQAPALDPNRTPPHLEPGRTANGLALTPPMGWNSWNKFGCNVNERTVRAVADAMVSSGMRDAGYVYVVIDDCWHGPRDAQGNITADPQRFPSGMRALGDYIHVRGLKFGLYSDAGRTTCGGRPGSQGHEFQDARAYASWGVDYLKYDWCATGTRNAEEAYALMADALRASGRDIVLSICEWGQNRPWEWAAKIGNLWRTTGDIMDRWDGVDRWMHGIMDIVDRN